MGTNVTAPTREQLDLHHALCNTMSKTHPRHLTIKDYIVVLAKIQGQLLATCYPRERELVRELMKVNMEEEFLRCSEFQTPPENEMAKGGTA